MSAGNLFLFSVSLPLPLLLVMEVKQIIGCIKTHFCLLGTFAVFSEVELNLNHLNDLLTKTTRKKTQIRIQRVHFIGFHNTSWNKTQQIHNYDIGINSRDGSARYKSGLWMLRLTAQETGNYRSNCNMEEMAIQHEIMRDLND